MENILNWSFRFFFGGFVTKGRQTDLIAKALLFVCYSNRLSPSYISRTLVAGQRRFNNFTIQRKI